MTGTEGGAITYTAADETPTGWQNVYIVDDLLSTVNLTIPHGVPPTGVNTTGFSTNSQGILVQGGVNLFATDPQGELFWNGVHEAGYYTPANLKVTELSM